MPRAFAFTVVSVGLCAGWAGAQDPPPPPPPPCTKNCGQHGSQSSKYAPCSCNCNSGWKGAACGTPTGCDGNPNCGHGSCVANGGSHTCSCQSGWSGGTCEHPTGCDSSPCQHGGSCTPNGGKHTCHCAPCWTGANCGQRPSCGSHPTVAHANIPSCDTSYGTICTATCQAGYTRGNPGPAQSTCTCRRGQVGWNDFGLTCPAIPCSASAPENGRISNRRTDRGLYPGSDVTFVCNDGWYMSKAVSGKCRTSDGHYDLPTCTACTDVPHCPPGDPASHGGHGRRCTSASDQHCDDRKSCDPGYTKDVHCNEQVCPAAPDAGHRQPAGDGACAKAGELHLGEACKAHCNPGYTTTGRLPWEAHSGTTEMQYTCSVDGKIRGDRNGYGTSNMVWTSPGGPANGPLPFKCIGIPCFAEANIQDGMKAGGGTGEHFPGTDVQYTCNDNYFRDGCKPDGSQPTPTPCPAETWADTNHPPTPVEKALTSTCHSDTGHYDTPTCKVCSNIDHCPRGDQGQGKPGIRCTSASNTICDKPSSCDPGYTQDVHCTPVRCPRTTLHVETHGWTAPPDSTAQPHSKPAQDRDTVADVPDRCDTYNHYDASQGTPSKCTVQCRRGYTHSNFGAIGAIDVYSNSSQTYTCMPKQNQLDAPGGSWAGVTLNWCPLNGDPWESPTHLVDVPLRCDPIDCKVFQRPTVGTPGWVVTEGTSLGTFDPRQPTFDPDNRLQDLPKAGSAQNLTRQQLRAGGTGDLADDRETSLTCAGSYSAEGTTCMAECMPSWYPTSKGVSTLNGRVKYTCTPRTASECVFTAEEDCATGTWEPESGVESLQCTPGNLNISQSILGNTTVHKPAEDWNLAITSAANFDLGDICQGFPDAKSSRGCFDTYMLAPDKGPTISFHVTAKDQHGLPRNYDTLPRKGNGDKQADYLHVEIKRAELDWLDANNRPLQPRVDHETEDVSSIALRPYTGGVLTSVNSKEEGIDTPHANGVDGQWQINHRFTEHGIFYVSMYLCEWGDRDRICADATSPDRDKHLINGTGSPDGQKPEYMFTICPQNTDADPDSANRDSRMLVGQRLHDCRAKSGFFSPKGAGHIAAACQEGFRCDLKGMLWPVATADHWVDYETPTKMKKCVRKGACPGSSEFVDVTQCPSYYSEWERPKNDTPSYDMHKVQFTPQVRQLPYDCFMKQGSDPTAGIALATGNQLTGKPYLRQSCYDKVGFRCCPGATGAGCSKCCTLDQDGRQNPKHPSCNGRQWHSQGTGDGVHCEQCPPSGWRPQDHPGQVIVLLLIVVLLLPVLIAFAELMKHAGAATGPVTSVIYFFQSADLFQGLDLHWPKPFKVFCSEVASLLSSLNIFSTILAAIAPDLPSPECAFHLRYAQKWLLVLLSPILIAMTCVLLVLLNVVVWKGLRVGAAYGHVRKRVTGKLARVCKPILSRSLHRCRRSKITNELSQPLVDSHALGGVDQVEPAYLRSLGGSSAAASLSGQELRAMDEDIDVQAHVSQAEERAVHGWQYREWVNGRGEWKDFDGDTDRQLTAATRSWSRGEGPVVVTVEVEGIALKINLHTMVQTNVDTGRQRKIRPAARAEWTLVREWRALKDRLTTLTRKLTATDERPGARIACQLFRTTFDTWLNSQEPTPADRLYIAKTMCHECSTQMTTYTKNCVPGNKRRHSSGQPMSRAACDSLTASIMADAMACCTGLSAKLGGTALGVYWAVVMSTPEDASPCDGVAGT